MNGYSRGQAWWDRYWIGMAQYVSTASRDPSTKVGVVLVDSNRRVLGTGYNGFPAGISDAPERYEDREVKYGLVVHAEVNAILNCAKRPEGATLYIYPGAHCCGECCKCIIQSGIKRVCGPYTEQFKRWATGHDMLHEAGVQVDYVNVE